MPSISRNRLVTFIAIVALITLGWTVRQKFSKADATPVPSLNEAAPWFITLPAIDLESTYPAMADFMSDNDVPEPVPLPSREPGTFRLMSDDPPVVAYENAAGHLCLVVQSGEPASPLISHGCSSLVSLHERGLIWLIGQESDSDKGFNETLLVIAPGGDLFPNEVTHLLSHEESAAYMVLSGPEVEMFKAEFAGSVPTVDPSTGRRSSMEFDLDLNLDMTTPEPG